MKITAIETHILTAPDLQPDANSSSQDDFIVIIHTDEGISGIGETDTGPWLAQAAVEAPGSHVMARSFQELLLGQDPFDTAALYHRIYNGTAMSGRRGAVICALGAIDMALWDIKGKATGKPCWRLLGGAVQRDITPYASLQPAGRNPEEYHAFMVEWARTARKFGFRAAKLECSLGGPYSHRGVRGSDAEMTELVRACRAALGRDFTLMVDVVYQWRDAKSAWRTLRQWEDLDLYFVETPLHVDNLEGYAYLAERAPFRIATGEWNNTRFEFQELIDRGKVDVVQPDIGRVGGLTEALRVCHYAEDRGRLVVPHCWKTGIGIAASAHLAFAIPHCPFIEYLPVELCDSPLRKELVPDPLRMIDGRLELPEAPGLGVALDPEALRRYRLDAGQRRPERSN